MRKLAYLGKNNLSTLVIVTINTHLNFCLKNYRMNLYLKFEEYEKGYIMYIFYSYCGNNMYLEFNIS